jgi:hypothetical protein
MRKPVGAAVKRGKHEALARWPSLRFGAGSPSKEMSISAPYLRHTSRHGFPSLTECVLRFELHGRSRRRNATRSLHRSNIGRWQIRRKCRCTLRCRRSFRCDRRWLFVNSGVWSCADRSVLAQDLSDLERSLLLHGAESMQWQCRVQPACCMH